MKTILVTGASGMIGMEVAYSVLTKGHKVIATDRQPNEFVGKDNYTFVQASITDKQKITSIIDGTRLDAVVHLANSVDNDIPTFVSDQEVSDNKACDKYFWKALASAGIKDIMLLSTTQVYASTKSREPIRETADIKPFTNYAKMKVDSETTLLATTKKSNCNPVIMRVAPIYKASFTQNLRDKIYDNKDDVAFVYDDGSYGFSFCCIYNLVEFINAIIAGPQGHYDGDYNICDTRMILAKEILEYERAFHRIGVVLQKNASTEALKSVISTQLNTSKRMKCDYRYVDHAALTNNISYENTKAKRLSTFRWNLGNTK